MSSHSVSRRSITTFRGMLFWVVVTLVLSACGTPGPRVYRIGILNNGGAFGEIINGFKTQMVDLGYVEGQNLVYELHEPVTSMEEELRVAQAMVAKQVDLIFASPTNMCVAARNATRATAIPVVCAYVGIEGTDLVASVREPGGNLTGVRYPGPEQISKRLELLHELAPQVRRVWIGYDTASPNTPPALEALHRSATALELTLVEVPATTPDTLVADLEARAAAPDLGIDAILLMPDGLSHSPAGLAMLTTYATDHHLPLAGSFRFTVEQGAVFGNATNLYQVGELAAPLADKVLKGTPAGSIPMATPDDELWVNYTVAQTLGLTVPEGMLRQAVEILK